MNKAIMAFAVGMAAASVSHAAVVWSANFDGLPADSTVTSSASGASDTVYLGEYAKATVVSGNAFGAGTGNQLKLEATQSNWFLRFGEINASGMGSGSAMVVSFDLKRGAATDSQFKIGAVRNASTNGSDVTFTAAVFNTSYVGANAARLTLVVNQTGSDITLPSTLGTLANNSMIFYYQKTDGTYVSIEANTPVTTGTYTGFYMRPSLISPNSLLVDNVVMTNSVTDTVNGVNVLQLAPGAVVPVPEPASLGLLSLAAGSLIMRKR